MSGLRGGGWEMRDSRGPKRCVVVLSLTAIALLAAAVCALHWVNAVSLRGTVDAGDYVLLARSGEMLGTDGGALPVYADGERRFALLVEEIALEDGVLRVAGLLLRPGQTVGEVRVRVGLMPAAETDAGAARSEAIVLLNTQMVRRADAGAQGMDDHCGFCATAARRLLKDGPYAVVLVDESDGAQRLIDTGVDVDLAADGMTVAHRTDAGEAGE